MLNTNKVLPVFNNHNILFTQIKFNFATKEEIEQRRANNSNQNSVEQEKESWNQFLDFMMKREQYTWNDYLQQIIVNKIIKNIFSFQMKKKKVYGVD